MANGHGGARPGAGRKKKALSEKIIDGNPGKAPLTKLHFSVQDNSLRGEDMPPVAEYLKQVTKNSNQNLAPQIYEDTWKWLHERGCDKFVKKELIEQYALYLQRWIQCEEGINQYGLLAKHPTTQMPIASPYVNMGISFLKQANILWLQIYQIVKDNCETPIGGSNPNELFPNNTAKPIAGYMSASIARTGLSGTSTLHGYAGTTKVLECTSKNTTYTLHSANMSAEVLSGTNRLTPFMFSGFSSTVVNQTAASSVTISLTFTRYDFAANGVNCSVSVSSSTGYDGDAITFTATPNSACTFLGWYSGSTRLSTSKTYTHTVNGADVTLTARATDPPIRRRYLLWGNEIKLGDEINENFSVTYGSRTLVENLNGSKTLLCKYTYMADKVYLGTRSANCAQRRMPKNLVAMVCKLYNENKC